MSNAYQRRGPPLGRHRELRHDRFLRAGTGFARSVGRVWTDQPGLVVNPSFGNGEIMTQLPYLIQATGSIIAVIDGQPYYFDQVSPDTYKERFFGWSSLRSGTTSTSSSTRRAHGSCSTVSRSRTRPT